jgi:hypothetical protein
MRVNACLYRPFLHRRDTMQRWHRYAYGVYATAVATVIAVATTIAAAAAGTLSSQSHCYMHTIVQSTALKRAHCIGPHTVTASAATARATVIS